MNENKFILEDNSEVEFNIQGSAQLGEKPNAIKVIQTMETVYMCTWDSDKSKWIVLNENGELMSEELLSFSGELVDMGLKEEGLF